MKAITINSFGGPEQLNYSEAPIPQPEGDEIRIKNVIVGVGKPDYLVRSGNDPYLKDKLPGLIIGNESSGIVDAVGPDVKGFAVGDHVAMLNPTGCGSHAEYSCGSERFAIKLPSDIPFEKLAGILNLQVAYAIIYDVARGTDAQSLYISGAAGGIGTTIVQVAMDKGLDVIASASSDEKCEVLRKLGVPHVFNYKTVDEAEELKKITNGRGVDIILDQTAGPAMVKRMDSLADFGMIILYNWLNGDPQFDQLNSIITNAPHARAIRSFSFHVYDNKTERRLANAEKVFEMVRQGRITPLIAAEFPLAEAKKAHELLDSGKAIGKIILKP